MQAPTPQQREMMEEAAARIAQDNCELACCFIQKTAVEKAGPEMDKRLATVSIFVLQQWRGSVMQSFSCNPNQIVGWHSGSLDSTVA